MTPSVRLGFSIPDGKPVDIPIGHMVACGQTQSAGKTTTLEALVTRSGLRAVTFITKRGEGSFTNARQTQPYFRERADWQYVAAVLEASRGEKLKFERAWIIRASKGASTLADVQANIRKELANPKTRGMSADVYLTLDAYLDVVVPTIQRIKWAKTLDLHPGVNAVDLTDVPLEMQHLVIRSSIDWVLEREQKTVVVIPEAWRFIPQGRGTPVKLGAEAFIRQGAALGNYLWIDSQDLGGIDKAILRSVIVWLLGVQRESNEIKRTLDNLPASTPQLKAADIASLELGQFYACWGRHAIKTYVQPAWLGETFSEEVARGTRQVTLGPKGMKWRESVNPEEAARLTRENEQLKATIADLKRRLEALDGHSGQHQRQPERAQLGSSGPEPAVRPRTEDPEAPASHPQRTFTVEESRDNETLYQAIKARLIEELPGDARLMQIVLSRPELAILVKRETVQVDGKSAVGMTAQLVKDGFFDQPASANAAWNDLKRRGFIGAAARIYEACDKLVVQGFLTKEADGYRAVAGMKISITEAA